MRREWRATSSTVRMDLKAVLKSKKNRILRVDLKIGGRQWTVRRGKLVYKLTLSPLRINLPSHGLGSHSHDAAKVCGAGGGGCLLFLAPPDRTGAVRRALAESGASVLDCRIDTCGLQVSVS